jgi:hypothetical protein
MVTPELLNFVHSIIVLASILLGIWLAGTYVRRFRLYLEGRESLAMLDSRGMLLLVWVTLSAVFAATVSDILTIFQDLIIFLLSRGVTGDLGTAVAFWGRTSWELYTLTVDGLAICVYAGVLFLGWKALEPGRLMELTGIHLELKDRILLLLAAGSLAYDLASRIILGIVWLQIPVQLEKGTFGFLAVVLMAVLLIAFILLFLDYRLTGFELEQELKD